MGRLEGCSAIVTGGSRSQGEAEARLIIDEGAHVTIMDVLEEGEALAAELGERARFVCGDVSSEDDWKAAATLPEYWPPLRVLINNAGIHAMSPIESETIAQFQGLLQVNLIGSFLGMRSVIPAMRTAGGGSIVNVSSTAGLSGFAYQGAYGASKWGLRGLSRTAAVELGPQGIRVNTIFPGPIDTVMMRSSPSFEHVSQDPTRMERLPLRRHGEADEVAQLALFLASSESSYISGAEITIDGGLASGPKPLHAWRGEQSNAS